MPSVALPENHADRFVPLIRCQRAQEVIDRAMLSARLRPRGDLEHAIFNGEIHARRGDVDVIRQSSGVFPDFGDRHCGRARQDLRQHAVVGRVEVLDQHECHAGVGSHLVQQLAESFQTTSRRTDPNDREWAIGPGTFLARRSGFRYGGLLAATTGS